MTKEERIARIKERAKINEKQLRERDWRLMEQALKSGKPAQALKLVKVGF